MVDVIIEKIAEGLASIPIVSLSAGLVTSQILEVDNTRRVFPKAFSYSKLKDNLPELVLVFPDSKERLILYWESLAEDFNDSTVHQYTCQVRLVGWYDTRKLNPSERSNLISYLVSKVPTTVAPSKAVASVQVKFKGEEIRSSNPFSKWSMDEQKNQFLMHPYNWFALKFQIRFINTIGCYDPIQIVETC